jgi:hypothetical protein
MLCNLIFVTSVLSEDPHADNNEDNVISDRWGECHSFCHLLPLRRPKSARVLIC